MAVAFGPVVTVTLAAILHAGHVHIEGGVGEGDNGYDL